MPLTETTNTASVRGSCSASHASQSSDRRNLHRIVQSCVAIPGLHSLQVRSERGVLPEDHAERVATRLGLAISAVEREDASAATAILEAYMDDEEDRTTKVFAAPIMTRAQMPRMFGCAVVVRCFPHSVMLYKRGRVVHAAQRHQMHLSAAALRANVVLARGSNYMSVAPAWLAL